MGLFSQVADLIAKARGNVVGIAMLFAPPQTPAVALGGRMRTWEDTVRCNGDGVQAKALVWEATAQFRRCQAVSSGVLARIVTRLPRVVSEKMQHRGPPQEWIADRKGIYTPGAVAPMFFNVVMFFNVICL